MLGSQNRPNLNMILLTESQWAMRMGEERSPSTMWRKVTRVHTPARPSTLKALCLPFLMGSSACLRDQTQVLHQLHLVRTSLEYYVFCIMFVLAWYFLFRRVYGCHLLFARHRLSCCSLTACCDMVVSWLWCSSDLTVVVLPSLVFHVVLVQLCHPLCTC